MNTINRKNRDIILHEAMDQLEVALGGHPWKVTVRPNKKVLREDQVVIYDIGTELYRAVPFVTKHFTDEQIARDLKILQGEEKMLIVAEKIAQETKNILRERGIDYLDVHGNCSIKTDDATGKLFFRIEGRKNKEYQKEKLPRPFAKAGLKVTYRFLQHPELINATYREIAAKAGVALGNIKHIIDGLVEQNFVQRKNKNIYAIINYDELLDTWVRAYGEKLRPALEVGTFRFLNNMDQLRWKDVQLDKNKTCWGGEPAADLWTNYLRPEIITVYTTETRNELIRNYKFIPDPNGPIKAYRKFWAGDEAEEKTDTILTYADLILTKDGRCLETANMIYDKFIRENLQRA